MLELLGSTGQAFWMCMARCSTRVLNAIHRGSSFYCLYSGKHVGTFHVWKWKRKNPPEAEGDP